MDWGTLTLLQSVSQPLDMSQLTFRIYTWDRSHVIELLIKAADDKVRERVQCSPLPASAVQALLHRAPRLAEWLPSGKVNRQNTSTH